MRLYIISIYGNLIGDVRTVLMSLDQAGSFIY